MFNDLEKKLIERVLNILLAKHDQIEDCQFRNQILDLGCKIEDILEQKRPVFSENENKL